MRKSPTIYDVAERAGVSKSLVSLVLRGSPRVSDEKRDAVLAAVAELDYTPSRLAAGLAGTRTRSIGVVIDEFENLWFAPALAGLRTALGAGGYSLSVADASLNAHGLYMGVGFCAWLLGMHNLFAFKTVQSGEGIGNEFLYIIAAVVGGCLLTGGYGSAIGGAIGALIYGMALKGVVYAEWNPDWLRFFLGAMLLGATVLNFWLQRRAAKGGRK
jgi:transcriptional regulator with XRE-family HTH domain